MLDGLVNTLVVLNFIIAPIYFSARLVLRDIVIYRLIKKIRAIANEMKTLEEYGVLRPEDGAERTPAQEDLMRLEETGGRYYRMAVRICAFIAFWPFIHARLESQMVDAYNKIGMFAGAQGSHDAKNDLKRGHAENTHYYPYGHLYGLANALAAVLDFYRN